MSHFYAQENGQVYARHFVPIKSRPGEMRPTRITDVRKWWREGENVVPSVTTILNVLDKAALVNWKVEQYLCTAASLILECGPDDLNCNSVLGNPETFVREVKYRTEMEMDKAPSAGTDVHKSLEDFMLGGEPAPEHYEICRNVEAVLKERCGDVSWNCEERFVDARGFGGCADLMADDYREADHPDYGPHDRQMGGLCSECAKLTRKNCWVIDYKTKQTADKFKPGKMVYPDHSRQLAAYREGLDIPDARCANVFICIETGEVDFHEHTEEQLSEGWEVFRRALEIWQITNGYNKEEDAA